jgi:hypothetical protein
MECQKCKKILSKKGSHFICQGACQGTFHRSCVKGLLADMRAGRNRLCCNNCEEESDDEQENVEMHVDASAAIKDILKKVSVLPDLKKELSIISHSMSVLSDKYDTLLAEHEKSKQKIASLEKVTFNTQNKCIYLEKCNIALQQKIEQFEQATRKHRIEIVGVEQLPGEKVEDVVAKIGKEINVSCEDIELAKRAFPSKPDRKPAPIIVEFRTAGTRSRDMWLAQRRQLKDVTSGSIVGGSMASKVYINEDLTHAARSLLWNSKNRLRGIFKYVWVNNGKILAKKSDGGKAIWIRSENDLADLVKND